MPPSRSCFATANARAGAEVEVGRVFVPARPLGDPTIVGVSDDHQPEVLCFRRVEDLGQFAQELFGARLEVFLAAVKENVGVELRDSGLRIELQTWMAPGDFGQASADPRRACVPVR